MVLLRNTEWTEFFVPASKYSWLRIEDSAGDDVLIGVFKAERVASAPSDAVRSSVELKPAAVEQARIFVIRTKVCIRASAFTINPNGMILVFVNRESRNAVVKSGKRNLGHNSAEKSDGGGGELHFAVVSEINLNNSMKR